VVGYVKNGFVQIALNEEYRGKGILNQAYKEMANKHGLKKLYASIRYDNPASMRSHLKAGFKELPKERLEYLRKIKKLGPENEGTRLEKTAMYDKIFVKALNYIEKRAFPIGATFNKAINALAPVMEIGTMRDKMKALNLTAQSPAMRQMQHDQLQLRPSSTYSQARKPVGMYDTISPYV